MPKFFHAFRFWLVLALVCSFLLPAAQPARAQEEPAEPAAPEAVSFPGSYAHLIGGADWEPANPTVQGADPEGDGVWTLTAPLPAGDYEFKVAIDGAWDENYGLEGAAGGENIPFSVPEEGGDVVFYYDRATGEINLGINPPSQAPPAPRQPRAVHRRRRAARQPQRPLSPALWRPAYEQRGHAAPAHGGL